LPGLARSGNDFAMSRPVNDAKDRQLISLLRVNARESLTNLAKRLGVSRSAVQQRLARLERDRVVAGYTVVMGDGAMPGTLKAHALVEIDARHLAGIVRALRGMPEVRRCSTASGPFDLVVTVEAMTAERLDQTLDAIGQLTGVKRTATTVLLTDKFER
jgi:DNA-binding Lrp family transcriptional regulator